MTQLMPNHNHSCSCDHKEVSFCKHCNTVYCKSCNQEWTTKSTWTYPYWTQTLTGNTKYRSLQSALPADFQAYNGENVNKLEDGHTLTVSDHTKHGA
jgi:hypothetical protein